MNNFSPCFPKTLETITAVKKSTTIMLLLPPLLPITILLSLPALPPKKRTTLPTNKVLPVLRRATDCSDCCLPASERSLLVPHRSRTYKPWFHTTRSLSHLSISGHLILGLYATLVAAAGPALLSMRSESAWIDEGINTELRSSWWKPSQVRGPKSLYGR